MTDTEITSEIRDFYDLKEGESLVPAPTATTAEPTRIDEFWSQVAKSGAEKVDRELMKGFGDLVEGESSCK